ncbi:outer membrane protein assembly factor BamD [Citrobacter freundii]|uniref:outer membrane protein assembly factor BamD n=1 Tax=Citrobacter freundii TaxID=546 RepID=UPI003877C93A
MRGAILAVAPQSSRPPLSAEWCRSGVRGQAPRPGSAYPQPHSADSPPRPRRRTGWRDAPASADARLKIDLVRDHLAGKEMEIGRFYQRRAQWLAASVRFRNVVQQ